MSDRMIVRDEGDLRGIRCPELDLQYEVWGRTPVQAVGTVRGREFYFRARHDAWEFEVTEARSRSAADGLPREFLRRGRRPEGLTLEQASRLVELCAAQFLGHA